MNLFDFFKCISHIKNLLKYKVFGIYQSEYKRWERNATMKLKDRPKK